MPLPEKLYRFDQKQYAEAFVREGRVSFGPAKSYTEGSLTVAQQDDEQVRVSAPDPARHQFAVGAPGGPAQMLQNIVSVNVRFEMNDSDGKPLRYYLLCCSLSNDPKFFTEFKADALVTINVVEEFHIRLNKAVHEQLPGWGGQSRRVIYFAGDGMPPVGSVWDLAFVKDSKYAWEEEFRFGLLAPLEEMHENRLFLTLGSLEDICAITYR